MKTIIAGTRTIKDYRMVEAAIQASGFTITEVVWGCAPGVDTLGKLYADNHGLPDKPFPADWNDLSHPDAIVRRNRFGKVYDARAEHRRNQAMADYADAAILVWDGKSSGTRDMHNRAIAKGLKLYVYLVNK